MNSQFIKETVKNALKTSVFKIDELHGGFSKQVYKMITQNDSYILYIWRPSFDNKLTENKAVGIEYLYWDSCTLCHYSRTS